MEKKPKISSTAYRVLLLLQQLTESEKSVDDLNLIFSKHDIVARTFTKEVIIKYISTLKLAGYRISKPSAANKHTYTVLKSPILAKFTDEELQTLAMLDGYISSLYQHKLKDKYGELIKKLSKYISDEQCEQLDTEFEKIKNNLDFTNKKFEKYAELIQMLEEYCNEDRRIQVIYKLPNDDEKEIILEPKNIKYDSNNVYLAGFNAVMCERQLLNIEYIVRVKQLPQKSKFNQILYPVVFKLMGRLANGYTPYDDEKITEMQEDGTITVTTYVEDKHMLIQRLLKYGTLCEIIYPNIVRSKISETIDKTLKNYEK